MPDRRVITPEYLRSILDYDPDTGIWTWRWRDGIDISVNIRDAGRKAGTIGSGYLMIGINARFYRAHRLAFLYMLGRWPEHHVDHIDLDRANCRWANLREATSSQNKANTRTRSDNTSGHKGVTAHGTTGLWRVRLSVKGKRIHIGLYATKEDAAKAYAEAASKLYGEFARTS